VLVSKEEINFTGEDGNLVEGQSLNFLVEAAPLTTQLVKFFVRKGREEAVGVKDTLLSNFFTGNIVPLEIDVDNLFGGGKPRLSAIIESKKK